MAAEAMNDGTQTINKTFKEKEEKSFFFPDFSLCRNHYLHSSFKTSCLLWSSLAICTTEPCLNSLSLYFRSDTGDLVNGTVFTVAQIKPPANVSRPKLFNRVVHPANSPRLDLALGFWCAGCPKLVTEAQLQSLRCSWFLQVAHACYDFHKMASCQKMLKRVSSLEPSLTPLTCAKYLHATQSCVLQRWIVTVMLNAKMVRSN